MKIIILAAGQGTRLRPLTDEQPKCMVQINQVSIIERILNVIASCGIKESDVYIVTGYKASVLEEFLHDRNVNFIYNPHYESTNMVCSLMCAKGVLESDDEIIVSYGDIIYEESILKKVMEASCEISVAADDGWYEYWKKRCDNPLDDAETFLFDAEDNLLEIGRKTTELSDIQSQYIGLMKYSGNGIRKVIGLCERAKEKSSNGEPLWRTERTYQKMYMTDMLQGLVDEGNQIKVVHINRGWYEVDGLEDLQVVEKEVL